MPETRIPRQKWPEEVTTMMSGAMFVYPLTELEETEGGRDWGI